MKNRSISLTVAAILVVTLLMSLTNKVGWLAWIPTLFALAVVFGRKPTPPR